MFECVCFGVVCLYLCACDYVCVCMGTHVAAAVRVGLQGSVRTAGLKKDCQIVDIAGIDTQYLYQLAISSVWRTKQAQKTLRYETTMLQVSRTL